MKNCLFKPDSTWCICHPNANARGTGEQRQCGTGANMALLLFKC